MSGISNSDGFSGQSLQKFEATPLVVDGVMYTVQAPNNVVALGCRSGASVLGSIRTSRHRRRRGCAAAASIAALAILGDTLFMGTIDGHVIAIDAVTGGLVWNAAVAGARPEAGYAFTLARWSSKTRSSSARPAASTASVDFWPPSMHGTGKEVWRFNTIPGPGEPGHDNG